MKKAVVGQEQVIEEMLISIFSRGHCLLVGVPGLAKTLMVRALAQTLSLSFNRIQFTPDLMPSDITGTDVIQDDRATGTRCLQFIRGPVFANVILADEINRTPPKTQSALLEAMQELQVTAGGNKYQLEHPFFVLATQNPIEQEGTYPLPEAQVDRFLLYVHVPLWRSMPLLAPTRGSRGRISSHRKTSVPSPRPVSPIAYIFRTKRKRPARPAMT
jgi:MoxR-like ATPase